MTTDIELLINMDALDEGDALNVFWAMRDKFGWAGTVFTRDDVDEMLDNNEYNVRKDGEPIINRSFTDEQWTDFTNNKDWYRYVPEWLSEQGWEIIDNVLNDWLREKARP
jgi:hypothetical protein